MKKGELQGIRRPFRHQGKLPGGFRNRNGKDDRQDGDEENGESNSFCQLRIGGKDMSNYETVEEK